MYSWDLQIDGEAEQSNDKVVEVYQNLGAAPARSSQARGPCKRVLVRKMQ